VAEQSGVGAAGVFEGVGEQRNAFLGVSRFTDAAV
jgi:hypothetical protein